MKDPRIWVTVSASIDPILVARAKQSSERWGLPYRERPKKTGLDSLFDDDVDAFLVLGSDGWTLRDRKGALQFSPNMAWLRIKRIEAGFDEDHLVRLCELKAGDSVLDCTLGLAADALVCSRVVGPAGRVVGVEKSLPLWILAHEGLPAWQRQLTAAPIEVLHGDSVELLKTLDSKSFDCVLLDPMFDKPRRASPAFEVMRRYAADGSLTQEMVDHARRVARRWVVMKTARYTPALKKLGLKPEPASRYSNIVWARVEGS